MSLPPVTVSAPGSPGAFTDPELFFKCQKPEIKNLLNSPEILKCDAVAEIVASYVTGSEDPFGAAEWMKYWAIDVGQEPALPKEFGAFWFSPDPIDPTKKVKVCETHLPPIFRPQRIRHIRINSEVAYSFNVLGLLVQNSKEGPSPKFLAEAEAMAFSQYGQTEAGPGCWLVMRRGGLAGNFSYPEQIQFIRNLNARTQAQYEETTSAIDLATIVFSRYVATRERHLGDSQGMEGQWTFARCREVVTSNGGDHLQVALGGFTPGGGLDVQYSSFSSRHYIVVALRKF